LRITLHSLTTRLIAAAALWSGIGLLIGGILLANVFRDTVVRNFDQSLIALWEGLVAGIELTEHGELIEAPDLADPRFRATFSGWYWQVREVRRADQAPKAPNAPIDIRSRSLFDFRLATPQDVGSRDYTRAYVGGPDQQQLRLIARKVQLPGSTSLFVVTLAADKAALDAEIDRFNTILAWAFAALGAGLLMAMLLQVRVGLSPLRRVKDQLHQVRTGQIETLKGPFPKEIAPLADELNALIHHNFEVLERARTQVGNLAHALKTPLSILKGEAKLHSGPLAETVTRQTDVMKDQVDRHLSRARAAAAARIIGARCAVYPVLVSLQRTLEKLYTDKGIEIEVQCPADLLFRGDQQDLQEMVGNLMDNGCKWSSKRVRVSAAPLAEANEEARLRLIVDDDGPGLEPRHRTAVVMRGMRLDERMPGSGLGLSIVTDLAEYYRGTLELDQSPMGGLRCSLILPVAQSATQPAARSASLG